MSDCAKADGQPISKGMSVTINRSRFCLPLHMGMISSFLERDNQIRGGGLRSEVALAHDHDAVRSRFLDGLLRDCRLDFPGADEASFKLFAVERNLVKAIETSASGDLDGRSGALRDRTRRNLDVSRCCPPRTNVGNRVLVVRMKVSVNDLAVQDD